MNYFVKDLYVCFLGEIRSVNNGRTRRLYETKKVIIAEKVDNKTFKDVFSNREYLLWDKCEFEDVKDLTSLHAISEYDELEIHYNTPSLMISKYELSQVLNSITNKRERIVYDDIILNAVNYTYRFLMSLNISYEYREEYIKRLIDLKNRYILDIKNIKSNNTNISLTEAVIRREYLDQIIGIEDELNHLETLDISHLEDEGNKLESYMLLKENK